MVTSEAARQQPVTRVNLGYVSDFVSSRRTGVSQRITSGAAKTETPIYAICIILSNDSPLT